MRQTNYRAGQQADSHFEAKVSDVVHGAVSGPEEQITGMGGYLQKDVENSEKHSSTADPNMHVRDSSS